MKEVTTTITTENGKQKTVSVKIEDTIYAALIETGDRALLDAYAAEEYYTRCLERRAKDNCTSLYAILDEGHDFEDKTVDVVREVIHAEQKRRISAALKKLSERQRIVASMYLLKEMSMQEIAEELGIRKSTVWEIYHAAEKNLKNFLKNP